MNRFIAFIVLFASVCSAYANDYTPLVREGVKWHCRMDVVSAITETESYPYTIEIKGDTVIDGVAYKKCYYIFEDESVATNDIPRAFLREDIGEKKVYALYNYDYKTTLPHHSLYGHFEPFTEGLLYDFNNLANANQGWYAFVNNGEEDTITTEVIELNSKEYVKTTLNKYFVFIEGIGIVENKYFEHEGDLLNPAMSRISSAFFPEALPIFCSFEDETGKMIYTSEMAREENDYTPLVREGVKWHCRMDVVSLITETESYPYTIEIKGDTVINDVSYKKCYYTFEDESVATNDIPRAFLREDIGEKKVYALYNYDYKTTLPHHSLYGHFEPFTEGLLYDFNNLANANQGWYAFVNNGEEDTITTEVIELNSKEYVKTTLNKYFVFIEGIGLAENKYFEHEGDLLDPAMPRLASAFSPEALPIFCSFEDETGKMIYTSEMAREENDYTPLVREGVKWNCSMAVSYGPSIEAEAFRYTIELKGDTIINEKTYKRCYYTFEVKSIATNDIPRAFLREDVGEKKVYVLLNDDYKINVPYTPPTYDTDSGEKLLYDFNNWENPELCWNTSSIINSVETKTISYKGKDYKKTILNDEYVVVEGIGFAHNENTWCGYDLLHPFIEWPKEDTPFVGSMSLLEWFIDENGTAIDMCDFMVGVEALKQDSNSISIEISNGNIIVCSTDEITSVGIISMAGVQVDMISVDRNTVVIPTDKYPSGCYIIQVATDNSVATKKVIL